VDLGTTDGAYGLAARLNVSPPGMDKPRRRWWTLAGTVPYLNVITTQATLLGNEVTLINLHGRRMAAAVLLGEQRPRLSRASVEVTS
jgi:hypothetical protein